MSAKGLSLISTVASNLVVMVILSLAVNILPSSPFQAIINNTSNDNLFYQYLPYVAYFIPIDKIVLTMEIWIVCVSNYWFFQFMMKCFNGASSTASIGQLGSMLTKKP